MATNRRHHTVPRLLLRRFADDRGRLQQWRDGEIRSVGLADLSVRQDFYALADESGAPRNLVVDELLQRVEDEAAPAIEAMSASATLPAPGSAARDALAWFVAYQAARSVRTRRRFEVGAELLLRLQLSGLTTAAATRLLQESRQLATPSFERFRAGEIGLDKLEIELDPDLHVGLVLPAQAEQVYNVIRHRPWQLWRVSVPLLASDDPVCLTPDRDAAPKAALGIATTKMVLIPLDRHTALVIKQPGHREGTLIIEDGEYAAAVRSLVIACAYRELYAHPDDDLSGVQADVVGAFVGPLMAEQMAGPTRPLPTVDGLNGPAQRHEPRRRRRA